MFDISDPSSVTEQDQYIIKGSGYSDALYNHKAIMIDPKKNLFGFLYYGIVDKKIAEQYTDYWEYPYCENIYSTFTYDKEMGFMETASYPLTEDDQYLTRGIYIGDYFYLAANNSITSYKIGSESPIATVFFNE